MGDSGVGKSAMIGRLLYQKFFQDYTCTVEDLHNTTLPFN